MSTVEAAAGKAQAMVRDSVKTVIAASMVGTAIEFYDFYAYGTAAANYFPKVFFGDTTNPTVALLASLLTFAIAFIARPLGSLVFGHFGDRMGRKTTLVVSLLTMGIATFLIGCLPTYNQWGVAAVAVDVPDQHVVPGPPADGEPFGVARATAAAPSPGPVGRSSAVHYRACHDAGVPYTVTRQERVEVTPAESRIV